MEVRLLFNEMIAKVISPPLIKLGYTQARNAFYLPHKGNWGVIDFQKSQKSDRSQIQFTVNVGIASKRVLSFLGTEQNHKKPNIWDAQYMERLGHLMLEDQDIWWTVDQETHIDELGRSIADLVLKYAVPAIQANITDESLRDLWLTGKSPSLTEFQRLLYLAVLLKPLGPPELL